MKVYITEMDSRYGTEPVLAEGNKKMFVIPADFKFDKEKNEERVKGLYEMLCSDLPQDKWITVSVPEMLLNDLMLKDEKMFKKLYDSGKAKGRNGFINSAGSVEYEGSSTYLKMHSPIKQPLKPTGLCNVLGGQFANRMGYTDFISTEGSSCASGMKSIFEAEMLIKTGYLDRVLIMASEDQISYVSVEMFGMLGASLSKKEEDNGIKTSAFDEKNLGFRLGNGVGFFLIESEKSIKETGNKPKMEILSTSFCGEEATSPIMVRMDGKGYYESMKIALMRGKINPEQIDLVKTHGTGTILNNMSEGNAIRALFKNNPKIKATSYKPMIGHTFGPAALIEAHITYKEALKGNVIGIKNKETSDGIFINEDLEMKPEIVMFNAAGMGNVFGTMIARILYD
ncbi:hypothetical protein HOK00_07505 [bacterium]|jgi:3-oxoacyl-(acyl-carrier-protein) synthase|nr:hypothetical protein [bacterium]